MVRNVWSVICEHILTEAGTKRHSHLQIIEGGGFKKLPTRLTSLSLATLWEKNTEEKVIISLKLSLKPPVGEPKKVLETEYFDFEKNTLHINLINPPGLEVSCPGRHAIFIEYSVNKGNWEYSSELPIFIREHKNST